MFKKLLYLFLFVTASLQVTQIVTAAQREELSVGKLRSEGAVNSSGVTVLQEDKDLKILYAKGTTVPVNGTSGYAKGCWFIKTDAATGVSGTYENMGTTSSCQFRLVGNHVEVLSSPTAVATTGTTSVYTTVPETSVITQVQFAGAQGNGSHTSNYITFQVVNLDQDGTGSDTLLHGSSTTKPPANGGLGTLGTNTATVLTLTATSANLSVTRGDRLRLDAVVTGTLTNTVTFPTWMITYGGP